MTLAEPHWGRFCITCRYSLKGIRSNKCPECGRDFDPSDLGTTAPSATSVTRESVASFARITIIITGVLAGLSFFFAAVGFDPFLLILCALPTAPILLIALVFAAIPYIPLSRRYRLMGLLFPILFVSILWTRWPLRITFALHRPALERLADQVAAGQTVTTPRQVGMFHVIDVDVAMDGAIGFQLTGGDGGGIFLVRRIPNSRIIWNNTNWETSLGDGWYHVYED